MTKEAAINNAASPVRLWVGLLGGAVAWLVHFLGVYVVAEWRCVSSPAGTTVLGLTATNWMLLLFSAAMLVVACWATLSAYRIDARARADGTADRDVGGFMARTGMFTSGLFAFIIGVETVPIFFFANHC